MKKFWLIPVALITLTTGLYAQQVEVLNASTIVDLIEDKISTIQSFTGKFAYTYKGVERGGMIYYKTPDMFSMEYWKGDDDEGDVVICDGDTLIMYFEAANIAIKEHLDDEDEDNPVLAWNLDRLTSEYTPTIPDDGYEVSWGGEVCYKVEFTPKNNTTGFSDIYLVASKEGLIYKMWGKTRLGKELSMGITYYSFNSGIDSEHFEFSGDENTQIFENMLIPKVD